MTSSAHQNWVDLYFEVDNPSEVAPLTKKLNRLNPNLKLRSPSVNELGRWEGGIKYATYYLVTYRMPIYQLTSLIKTS